jgi:hypothetical protein
MIASPAADCSNTFGGSANRPFICNGSGRHVDYQRRALSDRPLLNAGCKFFDRPSAPDPLTSGRLFSQLRAFALRYDRTASSYRPKLLYISVDAHGTTWDPREESFGTNNFLR